ncbi:tetratricopeptide repeat protein [Telmatobacter sp. DSM 110680]|uniref:Tetratricopeptide repeat protein n=1 Tax=Telmatobacter sp. DSM 110680 TaxID=3036704 RepID=A0AAU7DQX3_9BACT
MRSVLILLIALALHGASAQTGKPAALNEADDYLRKGIAAQQQNDLSAAIDDYRKALAINPKLAEARANLGAALSAAGQFDAAIEEDTKALSSAPDKTAVRMNLGLAYYKKGDMAGAHTAFEAVHAARPQDVAAAVLLGYTDIKLNKSNEAATMLTPLENGRESNMDLEYVLAYALIDSGEETAGLPRMEKVAKATHSADAYFIAGTARLHRREFHEARIDLDAAIELHGDFPGLYTMAGQARDALGDIEAAQPAFEQALKSDPRDFTANLYLGTMRLKQRDLDKARPMLELALQLQPKSAVARLQMAKLNGMTGKYAEAATTLEELEKADPNWLDPHIELAPIYYKLHRPDDGQRERDIVQQLEAKQQKAGPPKQ